MAHTTSAAVRSVGRWQTRDRAERDLIVDTLLAEKPQLAARVREAVQAQLPAYRSIPRTAFDRDIEVQMACVLRSARDRGSAVEDDIVADLSAIGEARAQEGIAVTDMLRAWRIGVEAVIGYAREVGERLGGEDALVLEFVQSTLAWSDVAMVATAGAHRRTELALVLADGEHRTAFVRAVLFGTLPTAELRIQAEAYGLDPTSEYVAVRAGLGDKSGQQALERSLGFRDGAQRGLCGLIDGAVAGFLSAPPPRDIDAVVGVGPPRPLEYLAESFRSAARALTTAQAFGLKGTHDIASLGLRAAVALDAEVGESLRKRYLEPLTDGGSARELMATVRAYLACGMHVERTATRLFVHQNTVRYRLTRFEELTGASLRDTRVLLEVWWALELAAMRL